MTHDIPWKLLRKHFSNKSSERDNKRIVDWKRSLPENEMIYDQLKFHFDTSGSLPDDFNPDVDKAYAQVTGNASINRRRLKVLSFNFAWKAAAILIVAFLGWWMVARYTTPVVNNLLVVTTSDTSHRMVKLPDGSRIWINTKSTFQYPKTFASKREVFLSGEAYFEIAHDSLHPFIVHAANTETRVLGTRFNLRSYNSEKQIVVSLTEGKVTFGNASNTTITLMPNEKAIFNKETLRFSKAMVENTNYMAWKTKQLFFERQPLEQVMKTLSEVYSIQYRFENEASKNRLITASFVQQPVHEIMKAIALSSDVSIELSQQIYLIK